VNHAERGFTRNLDASCRCGRGGVVAIMSSDLVFGVSEYGPGYAVGGENPTRTKYISISRVNFYIQMENNSLSDKLQHR